MSTAIEKQRSGVVTLGDATVCNDDIALLTAPNWLNDNVISFWCEHLRLQVLDNSPQVLFILPNLAFFLRQCHDAGDIAAVSAGLYRTSHALVIVPINDCTDCAMPAGISPGGTHWSVLVYARATDEFLAFDSMPGRNAAVAAAFARKLAAIVRPNADLSAAVEVTECEAPRQTNSYDCGAHTCAVITHLVERWREKGEVARRVPNGEPMQQVRKQIRTAIVCCESVS